MSKCFILLRFLLLRNSFHTDPSHHKKQSAFQILNAIFNAIKRLEDVKEKLTEPLLLKIDHVSFGCRCEYPTSFESIVEPLYHEFRLRFELENPPRKNHFD